MCVIEENLLFYLVRVIHLHFEFSFFCYDYCFVIIGFAPRIYGFVTIFVYFFVIHQYKIILKLLSNKSDRQVLPNIDAIFAYLSIKRTLVINCGVDS